MRRELALLEDFKGSNLGEGIVVRKYRVKKSFNTRQGIVGEQNETKGFLAGQQLQGGAIQIKSSKGLHELSNEIELLETWRLVNGI